MSRQNTSSSLDPIESVRGNWLNRRRLTIVLWLCLTLVLAAAYALYSDAKPPLDGDGIPLGLDFTALWAAGKAGLSGEWVKPYSLQWFVPHMQSLFAEGAQKLIWAYPPVFYFVVMPLAALPYGLALAVWLSAGFAAFALVVRQIIREPLVWLAILAFPGTFGNAIHGQTGFMMAALLAGGLIALPNRPVLAGILFACVCYKPQYGLLIPLALAAAGYWRTFVTAAIGVVLLIVASYLAFGWEAWGGFLGGIQEMRSEALDKGRNGYHNMISAFAVVRHYGLPAGLAWIAQIITAMVMIAGTIWLWRGTFDARLKAAGLMVAALALTPYGLDYDLVLLGPAIAFYVSYGLEHGFRPWEHTLLATIFIAPPLARYFAFFLGLPLAQFAIFAFYGLILARARNCLPKQQANSHPA